MICKRRVVSNRVCMSGSNPVRRSAFWEVLRTYLELVLDGLVARLASGDDPQRLSAVLDMVEESVRQQAGQS